MKNRRILTTVLAVALTFLIFTPVRAADFPSQPVRAIVPFSQGGSSSIVGQYFQQVMQEEKLLNGMPMPVMYVPGAGGTIGARQVKDSRPDGYTILLWHVGICGAQAMGNIDFTYDSFTPVAATGSQGYFLTVSEDSPYKTTKDLIDAALANPNSIATGVNLGASSHLGLVLMEQAIPGLRFRFVQMGSTSENYTALLGGHTEVTLLPTPTLRQVGSKGVRPLALLSTKREAAFPDVPTLKELGYDVNFSVSNWWFAPKDTPAERVAVLAEAFEKGMRTEYIKSHFDTSSMTLEFMSGDELYQTISGQCAKIVEMSERIRGEK